MPEPRPCMPPGPTLDGVEIEWPIKPPDDLAYEFKMDTVARLECIGPDEARLRAAQRHQESLSKTLDDFPTLKAIGLYEALRELERVFSVSGGAQRATWPEKGVGYHTAKAVSHLNKFQCGETTDARSGLHPLAHVGGRVLAALAIVLKARGESVAPDSVAAE
jgi:hypothetical protein